MSEELDEWWNGLTPAIDVAELRAQLAAVTAERDALALELSHLRPEWQAVCGERDALRALVERYGADQWRHGNAGKEPQVIADNYLHYQSEE